MLSRQNSLYSRVHTRRFMIVAALVGAGPSTVGPSLAKACRVPCPDGAEEAGDLRLAAAPRAVCVCQQ